MLRAIQDEGKPSNACYAIDSSYLQTNNKDGWGNVALFVCPLAGNGECIGIFYGYLIQERLVNRIGKAECGRQRFAASV